MHPPVSLVIGGGSGHFPSYNDVVGKGFADGAVLGDLFASLSAEQVNRCRTNGSPSGAVKTLATDLMAFSKASLGDKTILDALFPFADSLIEEVEGGAPLVQAWQTAAEVCVAAADETASLVPKIGRARPLAERSMGTPDPGAISMGLIVTAIGAVLADPSPAGLTARRTTTRPEHEQAEHDKGRKP